MSYTCTGRGDCERCRMNPAWRYGCRSQLKRVFSHPIIDSAAKSFGPPTILTPELVDSRKGHGIAIDIGTTTLAAALVDLETTAVLSTFSAGNPQMLYGADIMSRIAYARERASGGEQLHGLLISALNAMIGDLVTRSGMRADVRSVVIVGNPTMLHTLTGADTSTLGEAPYEGVLRGPWLGTAALLGLAVAPDVPVWCPPTVRSHVGADTVASIVATDIDRASHLTLLIDLGTNTEIALASSQGVIVTSASGGPAFEVGSIRCGMRAIPGAIDRVRIDDNGRVSIHTVGNAAPIGICGSGLLDAVAEMLRVGIIDDSGRMCAPDELPATMSAARRRMLQYGDTRSVWLAGPVDDPVLVTADDVRQLQLVKASIAAGTELLLDRAGRTFANVERVLIAGAFGNYVNKASALALGLLPPLDPAAIEFVGHTAGIGARMMLVSSVIRERALAVASEAEFVDLAGHDDYQERFVGALRFGTAAEAAA